MTAANRGTMRPNGRSPPFLIIGLVVALVILAFNYWNLSVKNGEQANEISMLQSEIRLVGAKKVSAEKRNEALSDKVKDFESEINMHKGVVAEKMALISTLEQEKQDNQQLRSDMETELNSFKNERLPQCESDRATLTTQLQELQGNLDKLKEAPPQARTCDQNSCLAYITKSRDETLEDIRKVAGVGPILTLYRAGLNVGGLVNEMSQLHNQGGQLPGAQDLNAGQYNQPQQQVGFQAQGQGDQQFAGNQGQQQPAGDQQVGGDQPLAGNQQLPADADQPLDAGAQQSQDIGVASQQEKSKADLGVGDEQLGVNVVQPNMDQALHGPEKSNISITESPDLPNNDDKQTLAALLPQATTAAQSNMAGQTNTSNAGDGNVERKEEDAQDSPDKEGVVVPPVDNEDGEEGKNAEDQDDFDEDDDGEVGDDPMDDLKVNDDDKTNNELQKEDKGIDEMQKQLEQDNLQG